MRVCIVAHSHKLGGMERYVMNLAAGLVADGQEACVAGPRDGWLGEQCRKADIELFDLAMNGMYDLVSAGRLARHARRWQADVLHGQSQRGTRYATWAAGKCGRPAVATAHSTDSWHRFDDAARIICVSDAVRDALVAHGYDRRRLRRVHSGVTDLASGAPSRSVARMQLGLPLDAPVFAMVARIVPEKGHLLAVEALSRLACRDAILMLAGDDATPAGEVLHRRVAELELTERVRFLGQRGDVASVFAACDVALAPSSCEALGLTLIEAAAMSLPVVASRVGGIPEVVDDGVTGVLIDPGDLAGCVSALTSLVADIPRRMAMGRAARERFLSLFTVKRMCAQVQTIYRELVR